MLSFDNLKEQHPEFIIRETHLVIDEDARNSAIGFEDQLGEYSLLADFKRVYLCNTARELKLQLLNYSAPKQRHSTSSHFILGLRASLNDKCIMRRATHCSNSESIGYHSPRRACNKCNQLVREAQCLMISESVSRF